jgi:Ser/Thr protein kinase RdoA (MazF antagonist)
MRHRRVVPHEIALTLVLRRILSGRPGSSATAWLRHVEPDLRAHLRRQVPDLSSATALTIRRPEGYSSHHVAIVEVAAGGEQGGVFLKAGRTAAQDARMDAEHRFLTEVAPLISQTMPGARCPAVLAYYPDRQVLLLQVVKGGSLRLALSGLGGIKLRRHLPAVLSLAAIWLGRLHTMTRTEDVGNPFAWIRQALEHPGIAGVFARYGDPGSHAAFLDVGRQLHRRYEAYRRPRCVIHGAFSPRHVLVDNDEIYVIDLEHSRSGYPYEDLATFLRAYEMLLPWKRLLASRSMNLAEQQDCFLRAYWAEAGLPTPMDGVIMRLARVHALAEALGGSGARSWKPARATALSVARWTWWGRRFRQVCRKELSALRDPEQ